MGRWAHGLLHGVLSFGPLSGSNQGLNLTLYVGGELR